MHCITTVFGDSNFRIALWNEVYVTRKNEMNSFQFPDVFDCWFLNCQNLCFSSMMRHRQSICDLDVMSFGFVSVSAKFKSFLLIMCIDAPESTTNSLSSGLRFDGASKHLSSEGEKNAALFFSFYLRTLLASLYAASRAHPSCHSVSS